MDCHLKIEKAYWIFPLCLFFILFSQNAFAFKDYSDYRSKLIDSAVFQKLHDDRYWNVLLHYRPTTGGRESLIDDPNFFLASDGKHNPEAELVATISAFFAPSLYGEKHPQCRFPARYTWLKETLQIDEEKLPSLECRDNQETLRKISPQSSVLIFASPSFSGSSKIFGHTLLRIDSDNTDYLLSYAVNYAAHAADEIGFGYILKGLTGQFKGYFSMLPYYQKMREYRDLENRNVWEYYLNLDEKETRRMVLHILELKEIYSDYYFLDENCSFNILFLIEAGRPSLHLVDYYWNSWGYGVIPSDTVNVVSKSGIVSKVLYRPSPVTQIRYLATQLDKRDQKSAKTIAIHGLSSDTLVSSQISREEKRRTLALAEEYLKYRYSRMELRQEEFQEQFFQLADAAKGLGVDSKSHEKIPEPTPPESRYTPAKVDFGLGYREDSPFVEITLRPAYRDLLELEDNSYEASQVKILEVSGRYYEKGGTIKLQEATILNILSLSARDIFFRPISWKLLAGVEQNLFPNGDEDIVFQLSAGGGWSFSHPFWGLFYALIEVDTKLSSRFIDNVAFGPGATIGLLKKVSERWNVGFYGQGIFYELGENYKLYKCGFNQLYELTKNSAIFLNFGTERADSETRTEIRMGWSYYF